MQIFIAYIPTVNCSEYCRVSLSLSELICIFCQLWRVWVVVIMSWVKSLEFRDKVSQKLLSCLTGELSLNYPVLWGIVL